MQCFDKTRKGPLRAEESDSNSRSNDDSPSLEILQAVSELEPAEILITGFGFVLWGWFIK